MALIDKLDFEEEDLSDWNDGTATLEDGAIAASDTRKNSGSWSCKCTVVDANDRAYGKYDSGADKGELYLKFYFSIEDLNMADGDSFRIAMLGGSGEINPQMNLTRSGDTYQLDGQAYLNTSVAINKAGFNKVEVYIKPETAEDEDDGIVKWWVNDSLEQDQSNDGNNYEDVFRTYIIGFRINVDANTNGDMYLDDIEFHDSMPSAEDLNVSASECE